MSESLAYEFGNGTHVGKVRKQNEDNLLLLQPADKEQESTKGHLVLVCDGMGGAAGGKQASSMAVDVIGQHYYSPESGDDPRISINNAIRMANEKILRKSQNSPELKGMGTTAVAAMIIDDNAYISHVGDSRCYLIRDKTIRALTVDHTMVQEMVNKGMITPDQAINHPEGHILSRSIGVQEKLEVSVTMEPLRLKQGDALLLCSDGLTGPVTDDELLTITSNNSAQSAVDRLIKLANERGGPDNITLQIVKIHDKNSEISVAEETTILTAAVGKGRRWTFWLGLIVGAAFLTMLGLYAFDVIDLQAILSN